MDFDDAVPPAIRRSPRAALEVQKRLNEYSYPLYEYQDSDESDEDPDEATPPPIARSRSNSVDSEQAREAAPRANFNPLRAHPVETETETTTKPAHKFSYPFREQLESPDPTPPVLPARRRPRGLISYRNNKKLPLHLRRQPSLETINSVTTTASEAPSEDYVDPPGAEAPSPEWFTGEDDPPVTPVPTSATSKTPSTSSLSGSSYQSSTPAETPLEFTSLDHHSPQSLFRKMMPRKTEKTEGSPPTPTRLVIERKVSFDRTSHPSTLSRSTISLPPAPSLESGFFSVERSQSKSSSEWSASSFAISSLTEAEIKKCKKKGINPALYAEMRAAKKGKWTSPIAGNTFL